MFLQVTGHMSAGSVSGQANIRLLTRGLQSQSTESLAQKQQPSTKQPFNFFLSTTRKRLLDSSIEEITARANPPPTVVHRRLSLEFRPDGTRYVVTNKQVDLGLVRAPEHLD